MESKPDQSPEVAQSGRQLPGAPLSDRTVMLALAFILGLVFLGYFNTLGFAFVHDDRFQIQGNCWLRS